MKFFIQKLVLHTEQSGNPDLVINARSIGDKMLCKEKDAEQWKP